MKKIKIKMFDNLKYRMVMSLFVVNLLVTVIMNAFTFSLVDKVLSKQISQASILSLQTVEAVYDSQILNYQLLAQSILSSPQTMDVLTSGRGDVLREIRLGTYLQPILSINPIVDSFLFFSHGEIIYKYDGRPLSREFQQAIMTEIGDSTVDTKVIYIQDNQSGKIVVFSSNRARLYGSSEYGVALVLNGEQLRATLFSDGEIPDNTILYDNEGNILLSRERTVQKLDEQMVQQSLELGHSASKVIQNTEDRYVLSCINTEKGYGILSMVDYQESRADLEQIQRIMLLITAGFPIIVLLLIYLLITYFYRPINETMEKIRVKFGRYDTMKEHPKNAFYQVKSIIESAATQLEFLEDQCHRSEILDYLHGFSEEPIPDKLKPIEEKISAGLHYRVVLLQNDVPSGGSIPVDDYLKQWRGQLNYDYLPLDGFEALLFLYAPVSQAAALLSKGVINDIVCTLAGQLYRNGIEFSYGVTNICSTFQQIKDGYQTITHLAKNSILYEKNNIFFEEDKIQGKKYTKLAATLVQTQNELIRKNSIEEIDELLENAFRMVARAGLDFDSAAKVFASMLSACVITPHNVYDEREIRNNYLDSYLKITACVSRKEIIQLLRSAIWLTCEETKIINSSTLQNNLGAAISYLEENFADASLSLEMIADCYDMSPSYFSKLIKKHTKKTFPEYLSDIRLKNGARLLLEKPEKSVNDIATAVGFSSSSYFALAFKKRYGVSPSKYRMGQKN